MGPRGSGIFPNAPVRDHPTACKAGLAVVDGLAMVAVLDVFFQKYPYISSFVITGLKGCVADLIAQFSEKDDAGKRKCFSWLRNLAFILYAGAYQGCIQHFIYNKMFPIWFGFGSDPITIIRMVSFELFIQTPFLCLPLAYLVKAVIFNGLALRHLKAGLSRYVDDVVNHGVLTKYWLLWGPVQTLTFSIVPVHLRIAFIAAVSFFWTIVLSSIVNRTSKRELEKPAAISTAASDNNSSIPHFPYPNGRNDVQGEVIESSPTYPPQPAATSSFHGHGIQLSPSYAAQSAMTSGMPSKGNEPTPAYAAQPTRKSGVFRRLGERGYTMQTQSQEILSTLNRHAQERMKRVLVNSNSRGVELFHKLLVDMAPDFVSRTSHNVSRYMPNLLIST